MKSLVIILTFALSSCLGQSPAKFKSVNEHADYMKLLYEKVQSSSGEEKKLNELKFFNAFPNTFSSFTSLYVGKDSGATTLFGPLYNCCYNHIELFHSLESINKETYFNKYINIAINGKWDADHVSGFQSGLQTKFFSDPRYFVELLNRRSRTEIISFWYFFFDSPHPEDQGNKAEYDKVIKGVDTLKDPIVNLIKEAYKKVLADSEPHGH
jgi:hypothetical protein